MNPALLKRISKYCALQERCTHDVVIKLTAWEVEEIEADETIEWLRKENFLNDQRYLMSYVAEKWNLNHWGKIKLSHGLQQKGFNEETIKKVLDTIDTVVYKSGLNDLLHKRKNELHGQELLVQANKLISFAQQKGFEEELILEWIDEQGIDLEL